VAAACLASAPLRALEPPLVSGAFIDLTRTSAAADKTWWQAQLDAMREIELDTLIVMNVARGGVAYYPTALATDYPGQQDAIGHVLDCAGQAGIKTFLGLHLDPTFWKHRFDLPSRRRRNRATLEELIDRYGTHPALAGWYLPEEIDDVTRTQRYADDLLSYLGDLAQRARAKTGLPVLISPFFGRDVDPKDYAKWWDETAFPALHVDIVALQDGMGTHRTTLRRAVEVFAALRPVAAKHGVRLWANNESFDQQHGWPVDDHPWAATPVDFEVFWRHAVAVAPYVDKSVTFEFTHYFSPLRGGAAARLYEAYGRQLAKARHSVVENPAPPD
jgi:hypothetical protein